MPANPFDYQVYLDIVSALGAIDGTGDYHHDLSGPEQVAQGLYTAGEPPRADGPCVAVSPLPGSWSPGPTTGGTNQRGGVLIQGWAPAASSALSDRMAARFRLQSDIRQAVKAACMAPANACYALETLAYDDDHEDGAALGLAIGGAYYEGRFTYDYPVYWGTSE